jgi:hypothetical protein
VLRCVCICRPLIMEAEGRQGVLRQHDVSPADMLRLAQLYFYFSDVLIYAIVPSCSGNLHRADIP